MPFWDRELLHPTPHRRGSFGGADTPKKVNVEALINPKLRRRASERRLMSPEEFVQYQKRVGNGAARDGLEEESEPERRAPQPLPTLETWKTSTSIPRSRRASDKILSYIDDNLEAYWESTAGSQERALILINLLKATRAWSGNQTAAGAVDDSAPRVRRTQGIEHLGGLVAAQLRYEAKLHEWDLEKWMNTRTTLPLSEHGVEVDESMAAMYLEGDTREDYRLIFEGGRAFTYKWWKAKDHAHRRWLKKADTANAHGQSTEAEWATNRLWSYAISKDRVVYASPVAFAAAKVSQKGRYHSSYLAGDEVICAGTIRILDGKVKLVTTDSGHYQPTRWQLAQAIEVFKMYGVDLGDLRVKPFNAPEVPARTFLATIDAPNEVNANLAAHETRSKFNYRVYNKYASKHDTEASQINGVYFLLSQYYGEYFDADGNILTGNKKYQRAKKNNPATLNELPMAMEEFRFLREAGMTAEEIVARAQEIMRRKREG